MRNSRTSSLKILGLHSSAANIPKAKEVYLDEITFSKTDIGEREIIIISRPRKFSNINLPFSSDLPIDPNSSDVLLSIIKHFLTKETGVGKILFLKKEDIIHVWTIISEYNDPNTRRSVYKKESELMKFLSKLDFHFDFYLLESEDIDEVLSVGASVIYDSLKG